MDKSKVDWIIHGVIPEEGDMPYAMDYHTHGLKEFHNHPELMLVLGLPNDVACNLINSLGLRICDGERFDEEKIYTNILANELPVRLVKEKMGDDEVMVMILPDGDGNLPDDDECSVPYSNQMEIIEFIKTRY